MKTHYVSIANSVQDWAQDGGIDLNHQEIDQNLLIKWATDCIRWINTDQQLRHRIGILQIENSRAELPLDFHLLAQAAANPRYPMDICEDCPDKKVKPHYNGRLPKTRREDIVQWVQGTLEQDCELEINLICPACHKTACSCDTPIVEVEVDRIWEMAHPEIYYRHFTRIGRFGYGPGPWTSYYTPKFTLMRYASGDFFNLRHVLTDCPNVRCGSHCVHEFVIDLPYIEVDFERGEILISYLGKVLDDNGDYMIPDHPDVFDAIYWHLEHKWWWREYRRTSDQASLQKSEIGKQKREEAIGLANSALEIPEFAQFKNYLENNWYKRIPNFHHHENTNELTPGEYKKYSRFLGYPGGKNPYKKYRDY